MLALQVSPMDLSHLWFCTCCAVCLTVSPTLCSLRLDAALVRKYPLVLTDQVGWIVWVFIYSVAFAHVSARTPGTERLSCPSATFEGLATPWDRHQELLTISPGPSLSCSLHL